MVTLDDVRIGPATAADLEDVRNLLMKSGMSTDGVEENFRTYVVARHGKEIAAVGGAEAHQFAALLRSIAVAPEYRGIGLGRRIVRELLDRLASRGLREFYLMTVDGEEFFKNRGFKPIDRDEVHPQLLGSPEFGDPRLDDAQCMRLVMH